MPKYYGKNLFLTFLALHHFRPPLSPTFPPAHRFHPLSPTFPAHRYRPLSPTCLPAHSFRPHLSPTFPPSHRFRPPLVNLPSCPLYIHRFRTLSPTLPSCPPPPPSFAKSPGAFEHLLTEDLNMAIAPVALTAASRHFLPPPSSSTDTRTHARIHPHI